jgi:hypothetical protein
MRNISLVRYWRLFHIAQIGLFFILASGPWNQRRVEFFSKRQVGFGRTAEGIAYFRLLDSLLGGAVKPRTSGRGYKALKTSARLLLLLDIALEKLAGGTAATGGEIGRRPQHALSGRSCRSMRLETPLSELGFEVGATFLNSCRRAVDHVSVQDMTRIESRFGVGVQLVVLDGTDGTQYFK